MTFCGLIRCQLSVVLAEPTEKNPLVLKTNNYDIFVPAEHFLNQTYFSFCPSKILAIDHKYYSGKHYLDTSLSRLEAERL